MQHTITAFGDSFFFFAATEGRGAPEKSAAKAPDNYLRTLFENAENLLKAAFRAIYSSKGGGRGRINMTDN